MMTTATSVSILPATEMDREPAIQVLARAFEADPAVRWMYPDAQQYGTNFPPFVMAFAGRAFAAGTADVADGFRGAALWLPPGVQPDEERLVELLERSVQDDRREAVFAILEQMGRYHPAGPHWHLPLIGVDPAHQGNGLGSELLRHGLERCDRARLPAYLESSNPRNLPLYERHGFTVMGRIQVAGSPPIVPMMRMPR